MKVRRAKNEEILEHYQVGICPASYRHFLQEYVDNRTKSGVSHRRRTSARVHDVDGVPHVRKDGVLEALTASHFTLMKSGREFLGDLRLDSEYLPSWVEEK